MNMVLIEKYQLKEVLERERIDEIARLAMPSVSVVGIGGAGCNIVSFFIYSDLPYKYFLISAKRATV